MQEGPFDLPDAVDSSPAAAWAFTIDSLLDDVLDRVPRHAAVLLSIYAAWELDGDDDTELIGTVWPDGMKQVLRSKSAETAGARNLYKFAP